MLVKELISLLQKQNPDAVVLIYDDEMEYYSEVAKVKKLVDMFVTERGEYIDASEVGFETCRTTAVNTVLIAG